MTFERLLSAGCIIDLGLHGGAMLVSQVALLAEITGDFWNVHSYQTRYARGGVVAGKFGTND